MTEKTSVDKSRYPYVYPQYADGGEERDTKYVRKLMLRVSVVLAILTVIAVATAAI